MFAAAAFVAQSLTDRHSLEAFLALRLLPAPDSKMAGVGREREAASAAASSGCHVRSCGEELCPLP